VWEIIYDNAKGISVERTTARSFRTMEEAYNDGAGGPGPVSEAVACRRHLSLADPATPWTLILVSFPAA